MAELQQQLQESAIQLHAAEEAAAQARQLAADASHGTEEQQRAEKQLQVQLLLLPGCLCHEYSFELAAILLRFWF